jgi:putative PIN family toxin of toxin-antitoxin system
MLRELTETANEPKFRKYFTKEVLDDLLFVIQESARFVEIRPPYPAVCRDPKDDHLLELCAKAKVNLLVTGDADLLVLDPFGTTRILKPKAFGELLA